MMTSLISVWRLFLVGILSLVHLHGSMAFKFPIRARKSLGENADHHALNNDWKGLVRTLPDDQSGIYTQAIQILTSMQTLPSCNRLAASTLLESCQTIDGSSPDMEGSLEDIKSIYAARLALCEISSTGLIIPSECKLLMPMDSLEGKGGLEWILRSGGAKSTSYSDIGKRQMSQCLQSLESRPQWWTSYSNSRQNAVIMCQAARVDIERDEFIKLHKSMAGTSSNIKDALSMALDNAATHLTQQKEFAVKVKAFQRQALQDLESSALQAHSYFTRLMDSMETVMQLMLGKWTTGAKEADLKLTELRNNIQKSNAEAANAEANLGKVFQQALRGSSELVASQTKQRDFSRELAVELQGSLESLKTLDMQALVGAFSDFHSQIHSSNELVSLMYFRQKVLDERLLNLASSFAGLETRTEAFQTAQSSQLAIQNLLRDQVHEIQTEMQMAQRILLEITSSASAVQAAIKTSSTQLAQMATLGGFTSTILQWGWVILGIVIINQFSSRYAGYAAATTGFILLAKSTGFPRVFEQIPQDTVLIHYASGYQVPLLPLLKVLTLITLAMAILILYHLRRRIPITKNSTHTLPSHLRFLAMIPDLGSRRSEHL